MANIKSAQKRIRVIERKTARNRMVKSQVKTAIKRFEDSLANNDVEAAKEKLRFVEKKLYQAVAKGVIHKSTASRKVSRLTKQLNKAV